MASWSDRPADSGRAIVLDNRRQHEVGVGQRPALDDPRPVLEPVEHRPGQPEAHTRLAHSAWPGQGQDRRMLEDLGGLLNLPFTLAADEARDLELEVVPRSVRRARRRELRWPAPDQ